MLRFRVLGASFSSFGCFVFDLGCFGVLRFRVLGASCFGLRFRVLRFRNYLEHFAFPGNIDFADDDQGFDVFIHHLGLLWDLNSP